LERLQHEVREAQSGHEAVQAYVHWMPELVLLDVFLPEKDGIEVLIELRTLERTLPVVMISDGGGLGVGAVAEAMTLLGASAFLRKPFSLEELISTVEAALAQSETAGRRG
jgi:CheY-like chemotaxis protein